MAESDTASTASIEAEDIELLQPYMYEPEIAAQVLTDNIGLLCYAVFLSKSCEH